FGSGAMILGVGTDLIDIRRIERTLERFGERFVTRVFTTAEQVRAERRSDRAAAYAKRYAAKEACAKALGTGFRQGVYWRDIAVDNRPSGQPLLQLSGGAAARLAALTPAGMIARIDVSLTDEPPFGHAVVIISAVPEAAPPAAA
ncbi:MAG TPA: holo-ACP synthase, partial [Geminicoccaceae bacterium]|nr:holo-ACP synthase [Geminicoccaceae bacterium]